MVADGGTRTLIIKYSEQVRYCSKFRLIPSLLVQSSPIPITSPIITHVTFLCLNLRTNDFGPLLSGERLGSLNRGTNSAINDELRKDTNGTGDTEENSVVVSLSQTIVLEEDTRVLFLY
jgi:hypothetical protein